MKLPAPRAVPVLAAKEAVPAPGGRAMIVDDHPANLIVQSRLMEALGYGAETFDNAEDALKRAGEVAFDIVLTDINMPETDGYRFVERLRSMGGWRADVPVFAVSASLPPSGVEKRPPPGFHGWLVKPIDLAKLRDAAERASRAAPPPSALWRLVYVSRARAGGPEELADILRRSRTANDRDGVTGALARWHGCYVQVLEGERYAVERTFSRIARDPRHRDVVLIASRACDARRFSGWTMVGAELQDDDPEAAALIGGGAARPLSAMPESVLLVLLELAQRRGAAEFPAELKKAVGA